MTGSLGIIIVRKKGSLKYFMDDVAFTQSENSYRQLQTIMQVFSFWYKKQLMRTPATHPPSFQLHLYWLCIVLLSVLYIDKKDYSTQIVADFC